MLYDKYANEAEFREKFVKPLLTRMGFLGVAHTHGAREFGKDFVFSELTKFGSLRYYAAQVKHEESIQQTKGGKITELVEQVRQAFSHPFKLPDSPRDRHVSAVYIFNSGKISDGAKDHLLSELVRERFGDNVHLFDGDRLDTLNRLTTSQRGETLRPILLGLRAQLTLNTAIWQFIVDNLPSFPDARGALLAGIESYLSAPVLGDRVPVEPLIQIWQMAKIVTLIITRRQFGVKTKDEMREKDIELVRKFCNKCMELARQAIEAIDQCADLFQPL